MEQHQVDRVFGALVTAVHMMRASIGQSPLLGLTLLAGVTVAITPVIQPAVDALAEFRVIEKAEAGFRESLRSVEAGLRALSPDEERDLYGNGLSKEQMRLATYASNKYSVPVLDVQNFVRLAFEKARELRVDPMLVLGVMAVESNFKPAAQSHVGAQGLMQVHTVVHAAKFKPFGGKHMAFDPEANIDVGVRILKDYLSRTASTELALKFYVGAANHENDGGYAHKVLSERERLMAAAAGRSIPVSPLKAPAWLLAKWQGNGKKDAAQDDSTTPFRANWEKADAAKSLESALKPDEQKETSAAEAKPSGNVPSAVPAKPGVPSPGVLPPSGNEVASLPTASAASAALQSIQQSLNTSNGD